MIRSLIVWLVLLALPFQGVAAAAAMPCAAPAQPATTTVSMHAHGALLHQGHDTAQARAGHRAGPRHGDAGHHGATKCGSCAACWVGTAIAGAGVSIGAQQAPSAFIPFDAGHLPSVHPRLPERPPRSFKA